MSTTRTILARPLQVIPQTVTFRRAALLALFAGALAGLFGCGPSTEEIADGGDPLAALEVNALSTRYDGRFWRLQHRQAPERYAEAVGYCAAEAEAGRLGERPNCEPVLMADEFIRNAERELRGPRREGRGYTGMLYRDAPQGESGDGAPDEVSDEASDAPEEREER